MGQNGSERVRTGQSRAEPGRAGQIGAGRTGQNGVIRLFLVDLPPQDVPEERDDRPRVVLPRAAGEAERRVPRPLGGTLSNPEGARAWRVAVLSATSYIALHRAKSQGWSKAVLHTPLPRDRVLSPRRPCRWLPVGRAILLEATRAGEESVAAELAQQRADLQSLAGQARGGRRRVLPGRCSSGEGAFRAFQPPLYDNMLSVSRPYMTIYGISRPYMTIYRVSANLP